MKYSHSPTKTLALRAVFLFGCLGVAPFGYGQWSTWNPVGGDWSDSSSWDPSGTLPDSTRNVDIRGAVDITGSAASANSYVNGGTVNVMTGGEWTNSNLFISDLTSGQNGVMTISGGGTVATSGDARVESAAEAKVAGSGSLWSAPSLEVGTAVAGTPGGTLEVSDGGEAQAEQIQLHNASRLVVGAPSGQAAVAPGIVNVSILEGDTESTLVFNHTDNGGSYAFPADIWNVNVRHESGHTTFSGLQVSTGSTIVEGGTLSVNSWLTANEISVKNGGTLSAFAPLGASNISVEAGGTLNAWSALYVPAGGSIVVDGSLSHVRLGGGAPTSLPITNGTTLGGSGTITVGSLTIGDGGIVAPGNSPGTLEVNTIGGHIWEGGGTYQWEINNAGGAAGFQWDLINVLNGSLNITATNANKFTLELISLLPGNTPGSLEGWNPLNDYEWTILTAANGGIDAGLGGFDPGAFDLDLTAFEAFNATDGIFSLAQEDDSLVLHYEANVSAVPEPGSAVALALLLTSSVGLHRQRGKKSRSQGS